MWLKISILVLVLFCSCSSNTSSNTVKVSVLQSVERNGEVYFECVEEDIEISLMSVQFTKVSQNRNNSLYHVSGIIRDKETGDPLPGANVIVKQSKTIITGASCDTKGHFDLSFKIDSAALGKDIAFRFEFILYQTETIDLQTVLSKRK